MIKQLKDSILIKDFSSFKEIDWLMFGHYTADELESLMANKHTIAIDWEITMKFSFRMLRVSFSYTNEANGAIIEASQSFPLEGNIVLLTTQIQVPECLIDRSYYNNNVQLAINDDEYELIQLYEKIFKDNNAKNRKYSHNVIRYEYLEIDNNNNIDYVIRYTYYDTSGLNTAMGIKGYYHTIASTSDDDFKEKLTKMIEDKYTTPLLNKTLIELTDDDILVLEMNNT
jgi:hypothetical protein